MLAFLKTVFEILFGGYRHRRNVAFWRLALNKVTINTAVSKSDLQLRENEKRMNINEQRNKK